MIQTYRTLRVAGGEEGVLSVVIDAPPMNLIGPELVRDLVTLLSDLDADANARRIASFPAEGVRTAKQVLNDLTLPGADAIRADARRFRQLVVSDAAQARTAALFAQGLQTRGPLELDLGDRIGSL